MSVGPYWWPDPSKPDGLPYIRRDGERNPARDTGDTDSRAESEMAAAVETLALAYFMTGSEAYARHAAELLRVWFLAPATRMNPNLEFAQAVPGRETGRPTGIIDTVELVAMLDGVALLARSPAWSAADHRALVEWFAAFLGWLERSPHGRGEAAATNNHGSWYDAQVCRYALFVGAAQRCRAVAEAARHGRIAAQIEPDGRMPRELERTRSFHYSAFNLRALFALATMAGPLGVDLFGFATTDGRSLRRALDHLAPFADPAARWPYPDRAAIPRGELIPLLRQAAAVYHEPAYEALLPRHLAEPLRGHRVELVFPATPGSAAAGAGSPRASAP